MTILIYTLDYYIYIYTHTHTHTYTHTKIKVHCLVVYKFYTSKIFGPIKKNLASLHDFITSFTLQWS